VLLDAVVTGEEPVQQADLTRMRFVVPWDWLDDMSCVCEASLVALKLTMNVLEKAGAIVEDRRDILPLVQMEGKFAMDSANDMQRYLDSHCEVPQTMSVSNIVELSKSHAKNVFLPPQDPETHKANLAELSAATEKQELAYRAYFKEHEVNAMLVPTLHMEPYVQMQEAAPDLMTNFAVAKLAGRFVQLKIPALSLPTTVKHDVGGGSLRASVMLYGTDDRELLSIGLALEQALASQ